MNPTIVSSYDTTYVALSFAIAFVGSFIALTSARRIVGPGGRVQYLDLLAATLALGGIGVWTMHFVGMAALKMDLRVGYAMIETLTSLAVVCLATGFGLTHVARDPSNKGRLLTAGVILGLGVGVMHYLGMYGMRFGGHIDWSVLLVLLSFLIAVTASTVALWLSFNTKPVPLRVLAAAIMAVAVCAMHYTGMAAAHFVATTTDRQAPPLGFGVVISTDLPAIVLGISVLMALALSIDLVIQKMLQSARRK